MKSESNWDSLGQVDQICGTFDGIVFKVNLRLFSALVSKRPVTLNCLAVEQKRLKFGTLGYLQYI